MHRHKHTYIHIKYIGYTCIIHTYIYNTLYMRNTLYIHNTYIYIYILHNLYIHNTYVHIYIHTYRHTNTNKGACTAASKVPKRRWTVSVFPAIAEVLRHPQAPLHWTLGLSCLSVKLTRHLRVVSTVKDIKLLYINFIGRCLINCAGGCTYAFLKPNTQ
jgi:hypothetical protein